jgi:hypothetical protein
MTSGIQYFRYWRRILRTFQIAVKNIARSRSTVHDEKLPDTIPLKMPESHRIAIFRFKSAKYTVLTFPILNLFEQFRRAANFYFLVRIKSLILFIFQNVKILTREFPLILCFSYVAVYVRQ